MVTFFGFLLNILCTGVLIYGAEVGDRDNHTYLGYAGLIILLAGSMDMIDGRLARLSGTAHPYGDYTVTQDYLLTSIFSFIAMIGSIMVSYTRARAEGLGVTASVGLMQRPERIVLVAVASLVTWLMSMYLGGSFVYKVDWLKQPLFETISFFSWPIFFLAISANITALRRLYYSRSQLMANN